MIFKIPSNPNHSMILWTYDLQDGEICKEHLQMEKDNVGGTAPYSCKISFSSWQELLCCCESQAFPALGSCSTQRSHKIWQLLVSMRGDGPQELGASKSISSAAHRGIAMLGAEGSRGSYWALSCRAPFDSSRIQPHWKAAAPGAKLSCQAWTCISTTSTGDQPGIFAANVK